MSRVNSVVRVARAEQAATVAEQLGVAFAEDPVMVWLWPDAGRRRVRMPHMFATQLRHHHLPHGGVQLVTAAGGAVVASAVWDPPGHWQPDTAAAVRTVPALLAALRTGLGRALALRRAVDAAHPSEPHWYLNKIGTCPQVRGSGLGAALLTARLQECDRTRTDAYLECTRQATISYYQRFGFTVAQTIQVSDGGPTLWGMHRTPH